MRLGQTLEDCVCGVIGSSNAGKAAANPLQIVTPSSSHKQADAPPAMRPMRGASPISSISRFTRSTLPRRFDRIIDYFVDEYSHARTPNPA